MTTQGTLINTLAPHIRPDIDAIDAIDKLQRFGESVIPGVSRARIDFWGSVPGCFPPDMSAAEFESKGIIRVDDGFGRFDEHLPDGGRKIDEQGNEECSASLVAKALGCSNHPVAAQVMKMARQCDTKGDLLSFGLSKMVKTIGKAFKDDHRTFAWAKTALNAVYSQGSSVFRMDDAEKMAAGKRWANFVAVWLMSRFAEKDFPEMATGAANYLTCGVPDEFFFRLGITNRDGKCIATQVAEKLVLDEDLALEKLLGFTAKRCKNGCGDVWEICSLVHLIFLAGTPAAEMWDWLSLVLDAIWKREIAFIEEASVDFAKATVLPLMVPNGGGRLRKATVVVGESECDDFGRYARSPLGANAAVVVQRRSTGNMVIFPDHRSHIALDEVGAVVRVHEIRAWNRKGIGPTRSIPRSFQELSAAGTIPECPEWYLDVHEGNGGGLKILGFYNGTSTHDRPASNLPLEQMPDLVQIGANPQYFEPSRREKCQRGICSSSTRDGVCPWEVYQLPRCHRVREEMERRRSGACTAKAISRAWPAGSVQK